MKVLMILVDGMRPDAVQKIPLTEELFDGWSKTMEGQSVFPSVTLPCHMSLFHSVAPERHGTTTNVYTPQVRPILGLLEVLKKAKKKTAAFYSWEQLRDISRPGSLNYAEYFSGKRNSFRQAARRQTRSVIKYIQDFGTDFVFLYYGTPDSEGHKFGWMSKEYMAAVEECLQLIGKVVAELPEDYAVIVMADHGGHDRTHGTTMPEDMNIPIFIKGGPFQGQPLVNASLLDIAPTVAGLMEAEPGEEWEGRMLQTDWQEEEKTAGAKGFFARLGFGKK